MSMTQEQFKAMWNGLFMEGLELTERRTELENELNEVKARLENVKQTLQSVRPLAGISSGDDLHGMGITDAIRTVLRTSKQRMSAADVKAALSSKGFDLSEYSSPMSSIYTVLGRLADGSDPVHRDKDGHDVFWMWLDPEDAFSQQAEISDDDIPF
jgi:hypothetical protein